MHRIRIVLGVLGAALAVTAGAGATAKDSTLNLVAYSTPKPVMAKIISNFEATPQGQGVSFTQSYGASGNQAKAVIAGQPADLVFLSTGDDVNALVDAGLVNSNWDHQGYSGIAADTVVVFAVRDGNPKHIKGWSDLIKPGVEVVTPSPFSSGSAKWNILAAYLAQRHLGKTEAQAQSFVGTLFKHVVSQDTSGTNATNTFLSGKGDVLITYESEAINARLQGRNIQYVIPRQTMLIELPIAVLDKSSNRDLANKFIQYVKSTPAQEIFTQYGFRPVDKKVAAEPAVVKQFPARPGVFTINDKLVGGWRAADKKWFDLNNGLMTKIEQAVGDRSLASRAEAPGLPGRAMQIRREGAGTALSLGFVTVFLSLIVALPIAALIWSSSKAGASGNFWDAVSGKEAVAALKLSLSVAALAALTNAFFGTVTAWVLVRDDFRGKAAVNAVIDLPFALPTIVAGLVVLALYGPLSPLGINIAFTRGAIFLVLLFVTLPFVVRTVQPVLIELDTEMEEAARSLGASEFATFWRVVLPNILPGILSGVTMAFARAVGEIGAIVIISGNLPFRTEVASVFVFNRLQSGDPHGAAAVAVVLLTISFAVLLAVGGLRRFSRRGTSVRKVSLRTIALGYLLIVLLGPLAMIFWRTFADGGSEAWRALSDKDTIHAFKLSLTVAAIAVPVNTVFGVLCGLAIVRKRFPGKGLVNAFVDLPLALSPVVVGLSLYLLYGRQGWVGTWLIAHGYQVLFSTPAIVLATIFVSVPFVAREVIPTLREIGDEQEQAAHTLGATGWQTFWRITLPSIRWAAIYGVVLTTARCLGEYGAVAVVSGSIQGKTETATLRVDEEYQNLHLAGAYGVSLALAAIAVLVLVLMTLLRPKEAHA